jgi:hypothetical protein
MLVARVGTHGSKAGEPHGFAGVGRRPYGGPFRPWIFHNSCDDAAHNLELALIVCRNFCSLGSQR